MSLASEECAYLSGQVGNVKGLDLHVHLFGTGIPKLSGSA